MATPGELLTWEQWEARSVAEAAAADAVDTEESARRERRKVWVRDSTDENQAWLGDFINTFVGHYVQSQLKTSPALVGGAVQARNLLPVADHEPLTTRLHAERRGLDT